MPADNQRMTPLRNKQYASGFTLVEILITIMIFALLVAIAAPNYRSSTADANANNLAAMLNATMKMARNEAITRGTSITVCATTASTPNASPPYYTCNNTASSWQQGWMIANASTTPITIIKVFTPPAANSVTISPANNMVFSAMGTLQPTSAFVFTIAPASCTRGYCVTTNLGGQATVTPKNCPMTCP